MRKYGVMMHLPEGKLAGFYAQIVKALAAAAPLFDRDKELIVVDSEEDRLRVVKALDKYQVKWENISLFHLPDSAKLDPRADDYGFTSRFGNSYLYGDTAAMFRFSSVQPTGAEIAPAAGQMEEFVIASWEDIDGSHIYCVESHLRETIEGIASRYGTTVEFLEQVCGELG